MRARALVLSDTHVSRGARLALPRAVLDAAASADVVVHAGDLVGPEVLETLSQLAPVHAVLGNNDHELVGLLPSSVEFDLGGVSIAVVHDSGPTDGRPSRLARMFPTADLVVYGHSHQPFDGAGLGGQWLLNPGSPTQRRRAPTHTFAWVEAGDGRPLQTQLVHLGP